MKEIECNLILQHNYTKNLKANNKLLFAVKAIQFDQDTGHAVHSKFMT